MLTSREQIVAALRADDYEMSVWLMNNYGQSIFNDTMLCACELGRIRVINELIRRGLNSWNEYMVRACRVDQLEVVQMMIEKGANDWNRGLGQACLFGHMRIIKLMLEKKPDDLDYALRSACHNGCRDVIDLLIDNGADGWNSGMLAACHGGHMNIVRDMIARGGYKTWNEGFAFAFNGISRPDQTEARKEIVMLMVANGAVDIGGYWHDQMTDQSVFHPVDVIITEIFIKRRTMERNIPGGLIYKLMLRGISRSRLKRYPEAPETFEIFDRHKRRMRWPVYQHLPVHGITDIVLSYFP